MNDPIVITGIGILSPLGIGVEETAAALREGESALLPCSRFAPPPGVSPLCGEVPAFRAGEFLATPKTYLDRNSELLLAATGLALRQAGIDATKLVPERAGILAGTAWAGQDTMAAFFSDYVQKGPRLVKPFLFPHTYFNTAISLAAMEWSLRGVHQSFASGRAAAGQALVEACDLLADNEADVILAGGCEALGPALFRTLAAMGVLPPATAADGPHVFDTRHAGLIPGEAGAMLALERQSHATARGAKILGTIIGAGLGADAPASAGRARAPHAPQASVQSQSCACGGSGGPALPGAGASDAIRAALQQAGITPADLACVCASANGNAALDDAEAHALRQVLGDAPVPVTAPASLCGDTAGACAALHVALAVLMRANGSLPPVVGLATPALPGLAYVTTPAMPLRAGPILVLATDPAGSAAALIVQ
jgi:3-oxoacyl-(acyl-carrier-protein) synthase